MKGWVNMGIDTAVAHVPCIQWYRHLCGRVLWTWEVQAIDRLE